MPTMSSSSRSRVMPCLPAGFRFHPTDEELVVHYLMKQAASVPCPVPIIAEVNIYQCNPWDLPPKASFGEKEWYFFSPRDRKYPNGARPNRAAGSGYWKATGTDKPIVSSATSESVGVKKALVFYRGKPPRGVKTDWIMQEYRLTAERNKKNKNTRSRGSSSMRLDDWVLCRIYKKSNNFQISSSDHQEEQEEGSTVEEEEDASLNTTTVNNGGAPSPNSDDHQFQFQFPAPLSMTKSCSLTDLLSTLDYSTLSQLLLDVPAEPMIDHEPQHSPAMIYTTPAACLQPLNNVNNYNTTSVNTAQRQGDAFLCSSDYGAAGYNSDLKRKRITTTTDGATSTSYFDDGGSSSKKEPLHLPSDSRSYCNQQQLAEAASTGSFQHHYPFLNLEMQ